LKKAWKKMMHQIILHLQWLQALDFAIDSLQIGAWAKCRGMAELKPSGAYAYKTWQNELRAGGTALFTKAKVHHKEYEYKTLPNKASFSRLSPFILAQTNTFESSEDPLLGCFSRIEDFWKKASFQGRSTYLRKKRVGSYGLRFYSTHRYGDVAVVPVSSENGYLQGVQCLNEDGAKPLLKGSKLFEGRHLIGQIQTNRRLLIAEGYATGAFLYEMTGIPVCICFAASNFISVAKSLHAIYPSLDILLAADNDRHLPINVGIEAAQRAANAVGGRLLIPDFGTVPPSKNASDWLDLAVVVGRDETFRQIQKGMNGSIN
jgi:hypothetical protein